jgi:hypothetical membrane protein
MLKAFIFALLFISTISLLIAGIFHGTLPLYSKFLWGAVASGACLVISAALHEEIGKALEWERRQR